MVNWFPGELAGERVPCTLYFKVVAWSPLLSSMDSSSRKGCVDCNSNSVLLYKHVLLQDNVKEQAGLLARR